MRLALPAGRHARPALALRACVLLGLFLLSSSPLHAQERGRDTPGAFDFFVLALSWSPTYCAGPKASPQQCRGTPRRFVVHGLWPQYARGYPDFCRSPAPYVPEPVIAGMADLMPSKGLVLHEWRKHGTCTDLSPEGYFDLVRQARAKVVIPPPFQGDTPPTLTGAAIEAAFVAANPGLSDDMIAIDCADGRLAEVRLCLGRDLAFTPCPEVNRKSCASPRPLAIPAP